MQGKAARTTRSVVQRMRDYRRRRRRQGRIVRLEVRAADVATLIKRGYLELEDQEDMAEVERAANEAFTDGLIDL